MSILRKKIILLFCFVSVSLSANDFISVDMLPEMKCPTVESFSGADCYLIYDSLGSKVSVMNSRTHKVLKTFGTDYLIGKAELSRDYSKILLYSMAFIEVIDVNSGSKLLSFNFEKISEYINNGYLRKAFFSYDGKSVYFISGAYPLREFQVIGFNISDGSLLCNFDGKNRNYRNNFIDAKIDKDGKQIMCAFVYNDYSGKTYEHWYSTEIFSLVDNKGQLKDSDVDFNFLRQAFAYGPLGYIYYGEDEELVVGVFSSNEYKDAQVISPEKTFIVANSGWGREFEIWDFEKHKLKKTIEFSRDLFPETYYNLGYAFIKDNEILISNESNIISLNLETYDYKVMNYKYQKSPSVKISANGKVLSGFLNRKNSFYIGCEEFISFQEHDSEIVDYALSSDGKIVAMLVNDRLKVYKHSGGVQELLFSSSFLRKANLLRISPDNKLVVVAHGGYLSVFDIITGKKISRKLAHLSYVNDCCFTSDSRQLITIGRDKKIRYWNTASWNKEFQTTLKGYPLSLAVDSSSRSVVVVCWSSVFFTSADITLKVFSYGQKKDSFSEVIVKNQGHLKYWDNKKTLDMKPMFFTNDGKHILYNLLNKVEYRTTEYCSLVENNVYDKLKIQDLFFFHDGKIISGRDKSGKTFLYNIKTRKKLYFNIFEDKEWLIYSDCEYFCSNGAYNYFSVQESLFFETDLSSYKENSMIVKDFLEE